MRLSFNLPSLSLTSGQSVRAEVISSDEKGSNVLLNGVPTRISEKLEAGRRIDGRIEKTANGQAVLNLSGEADSPAESVAEKFLSSIGASPDADNVSLVQTLRRHGIPLTDDWFRRAREMMLKLGVGTGDRASLDALALLLRFRSPESGFALLKSYIRGTMNFAELVAKLGTGEAELLKKNWNSGRVMDHLLELISRSGDPAAETTADLPASLADNLILQELLSNAPQPGEEGRIYFQWPLYWEGQGVPDTLEGESFVPPKGHEEQGYSLRILVHPPSLGDLEIALHRLDTSLWVHFSASKQDSRQALSGVFPALQERLRELSWASVKLTVGTLPVRSTFLGPTEPELPAKKGDQMP
ncbi:MAG TPA: flagellar hook-length control protein FliK, partial [Candidatus Ozemobacteraceae bacterium]|nr:flagellar hook-length control protein FliK [Candidatus Ozemobacteraceae bacterium]